MAALVVFDDDDVVVVVVADHVRDVQHAGRVRGDSSGAVAVRFRPDDGHRVGLWRRRVAHGADLRGLRAAARHLAAGLGRPRPDRLPDEDPDGARLLVHDDGRARDRARHQGEAVLRGQRL